MSQKRKKYYKFLMIRTAGGTIFSFRILKHKRMEEFQPLFYSFWCLSCLLKFSNFSLTFFNLCSHSPSFILKLFNLTSNSSRLNNLNTKHGEWEHRLKKVREKLDNLSKQLGYQIEYKSGWKSSICLCLRIWKLKIVPLAVLNMRNL